VIEVADLPPELAIDYQQIADTMEPESDNSLRAWSSRYVRLVLERCGGNKRKACEMLDITYHALKSHLEYTRREAAVIVPVETGNLEIAYEPVRSGAA
jgi:hypothetical protein